MSIDDDLRNQIIHEERSPVDVEVGKEENPSPLASMFGSLFSMAILAIVVYVAWHFLIGNK